MLRHITHLHIPAFPIAVARVGEPRLRGWPVAVAALQSERSLILSVSHEAREEGIFKGMPVSRARALCPHLRIIPPNPELTERAFRALTSLVACYTPLREPARPGHIYLDLTGTERLWGRARDTAYRINRDVKVRLGLSGTAGVAANKMVSSIASRIIPKEEQIVEAAFMAPLKVTVIPGIGRFHLKMLLEDLGIIKVHQLAALDMESLHLIFGSRARIIHQRAMGIDPTPVYPTPQKPLVCEEITLAEDENDNEKLLAVLHRMVERCARRLRERKACPQRAGAFLRAHYPAEFMASVISNGGGYYSTFAYISEAKRMGLKVLRPDINESEVKYTGKGREIRMGLMRLKELTQEAREAIVEERAKKGPFASLMDFLRRTAPNVHFKDTRSLIKAGCFDSIASGRTRPDLIWQALRFFGKKARGNMPLQGSIFSRPSSHPKPSPGCLYQDRRKMAKYEMEIFGFPVSIHPLEHYNKILKKVNHIKARDLRHWVGKQVSTVGWMVTSKTVHTREGSPMQFITFEDTTALYETVFFPDTYHRYCHMLTEARPYILQGKVEQDRGAFMLNVCEVLPLVTYHGQISPNPKRVAYSPILRCQEKVKTS